MAAVVIDFLLIFQVSMGWALDHKLSYSSQEKLWFLLDWINVYSWHWRLGKYPSTVRYFLIVLIWNCSIKIGCYLELLIGSRELIVHRGNTKPIFYFSKKAPTGPNYWVFGLSKVFCQRNIIWGGYYIKWKSPQREKVTVNSRETTCGFSVKITSYLLEYLDSEWTSTRAMIFS